MGGRFANREPNRNSGGRSVRKPLTEPNRRGAPTSRNANRTGFFQQQEVREPFRERQSELYLVTETIADGKFTPSSKAAWAFSVRAFGTHAAVKVSAVRYGRRLSDLGPCWRGRAARARHGFT